MTFLLPTKGSIVVPMRVVCYSGWTVGHRIICILLEFNFMPDFSALLRSLTINRVFKHESRLT
jgi:hypothetical protein